MGADAIPAAAIVCALVPGNGDYGDRLVTRLHLSGDAAHVVRQLFSSSSTGGQGLGALGAVLLLLSILSLARTTQRLYVVAWHLPARWIPDTKATLRWLPGLFVFALGSWGLSELGSVDPVAPLAVVLAAGWSLLFWPFTRLTLLIVASAVGSSCPARRRRPWAYSQRACGRRSSSRARSSATSGATA